MKTRPRVDRVYLDTEPLRASHWPYVSSALGSLISLAKRLEVPVCLPLAAELERKSQFLREYRETTRKHASAVQGLRNHLRRTAVDWNSAQPPSDAEVERAYDHASEAAKVDFGLATAPISTRSVEQYLFDLLNRRPPFDDRGAGLADAIIYASIEEDLRRSRGIRGLIISGDGDFRGMAGVLAMLTWSWKR